jgi:hypothetical protein
MTENKKIDEKTFKGVGFRISLHEQNNRILECASKDMSEKSNFEAYKRSLVALHFALQFYHDDKYLEDYKKIQKNIDDKKDAIDKESLSEREKSVKKIEATLEYYDQILSLLMDLQGRKGFLAEEFEELVM